jgi:hypothetical protein
MVQGIACTTDTCNNKPCMYYHDYKYIYTHYFRQLLFPPVGTYAMPNPTSRKVCWTNVHTFYFLFFVEELHFSTGVYDLSKKNVMHFV